MMMSIEEQRINLKSIVIAQMVDECRKQAMVYLFRWDERREVVDLLDKAAGIIMTGALNRIAADRPAR